MERVRAWGLSLAAALSLTATAAGAQEAAPVAASTPPIAEPAIVPDADMLLSLGMVETRMTVPVSIGAKGPWPFLLDTGAERTVVSRELADRLDLAAGPPLRVIAMAGPSLERSVIVPGLGVSTLAQPAITAPALAARNIGAIGILGIDALQAHSVDIDFDRASMAVHPSKRRRVVAGAKGDEIVVVAKSLYGQLIVTDARWRGKRVAVVIDTGSTMTIGNPALLRLVGKRAQPLGHVVAVSVTGATLAAKAYAVDDLTIGGIGFSGVPVAIADAAPFHRFMLENKPALMLGMDALKLFRRVRIDFANRDIQFTLPRDKAQLGAARWSSSELSYVSPGVAR